LIAIVCWLWQGANLARDPVTREPRVYEATHVNASAQMWREKLPIAHKFVCIADTELVERGGFDAGVEVIPLPESARWLTELKTPEAGRFPTCYRRLWMFSEEAAAIADRFLVCDIDLVVVRDPTRIVERDEDFVGWRPKMRWGNPDRIGGGLYYLRAGARPHVWENFRGAESIQAARNAGYRGSDQAWMSYCLRGEAVYGDDAGIYSIRDLNNGALPLPADARLVQFNGPVKPWQSTLPWVREHWPASRAHRESTL
jgi:hypothetical protein